MQPAPALKPDSPPAPVTLAARIEWQLTRLEHDVAVLTAWYELLTRGRRHDA